MLHRLALYLFSSPIPFFSATTTVVVNDGSQVYCSGLGRTRKGESLGYCSVELSTGSGKHNYISATVSRDVTLTTTLRGAVRILGSFSKQGSFAKANPGAPPVEGETPAEREGLEESMTLSKCGVGMRPP